jgi:hypothetical protein
MTSVPSAARRDERQPSVKGRAMEAMRAARFIMVAGILMGLLLPSFAAPGSETDTAEAIPFARAECPAEGAAGGEQPAGGLLLAQVPCERGLLTCITNFCLNEGRCCPSGSPYLSHCSCKCFDRVPTDCGSYSKCQKQ